MTRILCASACLLLGLAGPARANAPIRVVALSPVLAEIAADVGGPAAEVSSLLPPGVDPHTFEPAPADLRSIVDADLVLASGLGLENYLDKLAGNSGTRARIVSAGDALRDELIYAGSEPDPHWWNSIAATERVTRFVAAQLEALRPAAASDIAARTEARCRRLEEFDAWVRKEFAGLPPARRQLVTTHDAFGWFARDYGFTIHPISGLSPDSDPNARDFARLSDLIRREGIPAIFVENSENSKLAAALARESGARLGGTLYPDGLVPDPDGRTYVDLFRHNVLMIAEALQ
jgi:zinc/manganese transport system substrate-binding protein